MNVSGVVIGKKLSEAAGETLRAFARTKGFGVPVFLTSDAECDAAGLYELMKEFNFKRKELVVVTTSQDEIMAAHEAFCRYWLLDSTDECTIDKIDEILNSTKFGI